MTLALLVPYPNKHVLVTRRAVFTTSQTRGPFLFQLSAPAASKFACKGPRSFFLTSVNQRVKSTRSLTFFTQRLAGCFKNNFSPHKPTMERRICLMLKQIAFHLFNHLINRLSK